MAQIQGYRSSEAWKGPHGRKKLPPHIAAVPYLQAAGTPSPEPPRSHRRSASNPGTSWSSTRKVMHEPNAKANTAHRRRFRTRLGGRSGLCGLNGCL